MKIGVIGVGRMGKPMALNLLRAGFSVFAFDVRSEPLQALADEGVTRAADLQELAREADVIITSLPGAQYVGAVLRGPAGAVAAARSGSLLIETSTITPDLARVLEDECRQRGIDFVDSPVSGGVRGAEAGKLTAMVGGTLEAFERACDVLRSLASNINHLGPAGAGNMAKLIHQVLYLGYMTLYCEVAREGKHAGLDMNVLANVLRTSLAGNPLTLGWDRRIVEGATDVAQFPINDAIRDFSLAEIAFAEVGLSCPIFESVFAALRTAAQVGSGERDVISLSAMPIPRGG